MNSGDQDDDTDGDGLLNDDPNEHNSDGDDEDDSEDSDDDNDGEQDDDDTDHHPEDGESEVELKLTLGPGANSESEGKVEVQSFGTGESQFEIELSGVPAGDYDIVIDGVVQGTISAFGEGSEAEGDVEYETNPDDEDERLLDFEVFGLPLEIKKDGIVYFQGTIPTPSESGGQSSGGPINLGTAPTSLVGLTWILDDGSPSDRLNFIDSANGSKTDIPTGTNSDSFSYTYNPTSITEADLIVTYAVGRWDEYKLNFDASSYIVTEYKEGVFDKLDAGVIKNG